MNDILVVEDEPALAAALQQACKRKGLEARHAATVAQAREQILANPPRLLILDITLPDGSGLSLIDFCRDQGKNIPAIVITAHGSLENALDARRRGAVRYLVKPIDLEEFQAALMEQIESSPVERVPPPTSSILVGASPAMQKVFLEIAHASQSDAPVLLAGPTGSGKTSAARVIHQHSARSGQPFVVLHCQALPENLIEAELFGHERGAFTGAAETRSGHLERADGGTLFLDEIGDLSPAIQAKLLRFAEEGTFVRVGGRQDRHVNVRLITATHRDLGEAVEAGKFREDLLYRLRVLQVTMPPLKDRVDDIGPLAALFLGMATTGKTQPPVLGTAALNRLRRYSWPGNVRELRNAMEHAAAVCTGSHVLPSHLPPWLRSEEPEGEELPPTLKQELDRWIRNFAAHGQDYEAIRAVVDRAVLESLLRLYEGKPTVVARELGMNRVTLRKRLRELGMR